MCTWLNFMRRNFRGIQFHDFGHKLGINCQIKFRETRQIGSFAKFDFFIYFFYFTDVDIKFNNHKRFKFTFFGVGD